MGEQALTVVKSEPLPTLTVADAPQASAFPPRGPQPLGSHGSSDEPPSSLEDALGPLAHPQTLTDFARILTLPVDQVRKALLSAVAPRIAGDVVDSAKAAAKSGLRLVGKATDAINPDLVSIVSPRAGAALKMAQRANTVLSRPAAVAPSAAEIPPTLGEAAAAPVSAPSTAAPAQTANGIPIKVLTPAENAGQDVLDQAYAKARLGPSGTPTSALPDQKLLNALALEAHRAGVKLTPAMEQTAIDAVGKGATPQQAVRAFAPLAPTAATPAATAAPWTPAKLQLTAAESKLAAQLLQDGKTDAEVKTAIETARAFQKRFGTPTPTAAQSRFPKGMRGKTPEGD